MTPMFVMKYGALGGTGANVEKPVRGGNFLIQVSLGDAIKMGRSG